ncbi:MAG: M28 family peptidase [Termitinemataceae bacterium]|nr:MAG: M28 family peptidase [Termitinemataceae bacterium]
MPAYSKISVKSLPYSHFRKFLDSRGDPDNNRFNIIRDVLNAAHLPYRIENIGCGRHFFINPGAKLIKSKDGHEDGQLSNTRPDCIIVAHYDCVSDSEGANDNGASVFMLLDAAIRLHVKHIVEKTSLDNANAFFILSDKEEISGGEGATSQGSYAIATRFKHYESPVFIFDACGRGDTLIISTTVDDLLKQESSLSTANTQKKMQQLRKYALRAAANTQKNAYLLMSTPFSDDLGFLRAGIAAQTITVLPKEEAMAFSALVRTNVLYKSALINSRHKLMQDKLKLPQTWEFLNGPGDIFGRLTPENFPKVVKFILNLCNLLSGKP